MGAFVRGITLPKHRLTPPLEPIEIAPPRTVTLPVIQHLGEPATPAVAVGEKVTSGQLIAAAPTDRAVPVHSPFTGTVVELTTTFSTRTTLSSHLTHTCAHPSSPHLLGYSNPDALTRTPLPGHVTDSPTRPLPTLQASAIPSPPQPAASSSPRSSAVATSLETARPSARPPLVNRPPRPR